MYRTWFQPIKPIQSCLGQGGWEQQALAFIGESFATQGRLKCMDVGDGSLYLFFRSVEVLPFGGRLGGDPRVLVPRGPPSDVLAADRSIWPIRMSSTGVRVSCRGRLECSRICLSLPGRSRRTSVEGEIFVQAGH
ncbi:unnamed protein product [Prunus brigantina]